jgi:hypothetical protein
VLVIASSVIMMKRIINKNLDAHSPFHSSCLVLPTAIVATCPCSWRIRVSEWVCLQAGAYIMLIFAAMYLFSGSARARIFCFHCKRMLCQSNEVTISFSYTTYIYFRHHIGTRTTGFANSSLLSTTLSLGFFAHMLLS